MNTIFTILVTGLNIALVCVFIMQTNTYQKWVLERDTEKIRKRVLKEAYSKIRSK